MQYQISRNGQMYGPYTLEDLRRYLASGNVLPSDLAKSEEMPNWVPVAQILAEAANQSAGVPPVAPPQEPPAEGVFTSYSAPQGAAPGYAPVAQGVPYAAAATAYPEPPNLHWALYLLLAIVTCTLFSKVFTVIQAAWLKRVQPNSNGLIFYIALYVLWVINFFLSMGRSVTMLTHPGIFPSRSLPGHGSFTLLYFILLIVTRFVMSASLEEHFNGPEPLGLRMNPGMVFFFGGVYFQAKLNEINTIKQAARYGAVRPY
jgi:hypothetical protein